MQRHRNFTMKFAVSAVTLALAVCVAAAPAIDGAPSWKRDTDFTPTWKRGAPDWKVAVGWDGVTAAPSVVGTPLKTSGLHALSVSCPVVHQCLHSLTSLSHAGTSRWWHLPLHGRELGRQLRVHVAALEHLHRSLQRILKEGFELWS